jgi:hypothetical protein
MRGRLSDRELGMRRWLTMVDEWVSLKSHVIDTLTVADSNNLLFFLTPLIIPSFLTLPLKYLSQKSFPIQEHLTDETREERRKEFVGRRKN